MSLFDKWCSEMTELLSLQGGLVLSPENSVLVIKVFVTEILGSSLFEL